MEYFRKFTVKLDKTVIWVCIILFSVMVIATTSQIIGRYVLRSSLEWSEELARYIFIWSVLLGASIVVKRRGHIGVELIVNALPTKVRQASVVFANILSMALYLILIIKGMEVAQITMRQISPANGIRMGYIYLSIPISGLLMLIYTLEHSLNDLKKLITPEVSAELSQGGE